MMRIKEMMLLLGLMLTLLLSSCDSAPSCTLVALAGGSDVACEETGE
jgi:hypothetical protein